MEQLHSLPFSGIVLKPSFTLFINVEVCTPTWFINSLHIYTTLSLDRLYITYGFDTFLGQRLCYK